MITYLLKSTICLSILYLSYELLLSRMKTFRLNRYFLLVSVIISLLLPLLNISFNVQNSSTAVGNSVVVNTIRAVNDTGEITRTVNFQPAVYVFPFSLFGIFTGVYLIISFVFLLRFIRNLIVIIRQRNNGEKVNFRDHEVILLQKDTVPYSFLNSIFISRKDYEKGPIDASLINHEAAHIRQFHSADILFIELVQIFYWFNPFIYFFRNAIKLNHEYLADEYASVNETSVADYSHKLIDFTARGKCLNLTSGLNYSFIKKRISMLVKQSSGKYLKFRLTLLSLIGLGLFTFTACVFNSGSTAGSRTPDKINTFSGSYSGYRINDSTYYCYGEFTVISGTEKTKIKAHKLKVSIEFSKSKNYFENDFLNGRVFTDGVDVYTNKLFLDKIISYKADQIEGSEASKVIKLKGNAEVKGEDVKIQSDMITLYLNEWKLL